MSDEFGLRRRTLARSSTMSTIESPLESGDERRDVELQQIQQALRGLRYGAVNIIVQDGVVVQIDRTEKRRLRNGGASMESTSRR